MATIGYFVIVVSLWCQWLCQTDFVRQDIRKETAKQEREKEKLIQTVADKALQNVRSPELMFQKELFVETPPTCDEYTLGGIVHPFGTESMPQKWPGSSSSFGRQVRTNCHAEAPKTVMWGRDNIPVHLYNSYQQFKEVAFGQVHASGYSGPSYVIEAEINHEGYNFVLVSYNGILKQYPWPKYEHYDTYYPKTWGVLIFDNSTGALVQDYSYMSPEQKKAIETGTIRNTDQISTGQVIQVAIELTGPLDFNDPSIQLTYQDQLEMGLIQPESLEKKLESLNLPVGGTAASRRMLSENSGFAVGLKGPSDDSNKKTTATNPPILDENTKRRLCNSVLEALLATGMSISDDI